MIGFYKQHGPLGYLATYSDHGFYKNGRYWKTTEHFFQAEKFQDETIKDLIAQAETPKIASEIGRDRTLPIRPGWEDIREEVMLEGVLAKFREHPDIRKELLDTGECLIVEETTKEFFWGCGPDGSGQNVYGKILMKARTILRNEIDTICISKE